MREFHIRVYTPTTYFTLRVFFLRFMGKDPGRPPTSCDDPFFLFPLHSTFLSLPLHILHYAACVCVCKICLNDSRDFPLIQETPKKLVLYNREYENFVAKNIGVLVL